MVNTEQRIFGYIYKSDPAKCEVCNCFFELKNKTFQHFCFSTTMRTNGAMK